MPPSPILAVMRLWKVGYVCCSIWQRDVNAYRDNFQATHLANVPFGTAASFHQPATSTFVFDAVGTQFQPCDNGLGLGSTPDLELSPVLARSFRAAARKA